MIGDLVAGIALLMALAYGLGWLMRGWYDRRMTPRLRDVSQESGRLYTLPYRNPPYASREAFKPKKPK